MWIPRLLALTSIPGQSQGTAVPAHSRVSAPAASQYHWAKQSVVCPNGWEACRWTSGGQPLEAGVQLSWRSLTALVQCWLCMSVHASILHVYVYVLCVCCFENMSKKNNYRETVPEHPWSVVLNPRKCLDYPLACQRIGASCGCSCIRVLLSCLWLCSFGADCCLVWLDDPRICLFMATTYCYFWRVPSRDKLGIFTYITMFLLNQAFCLDASLDFAPHATFGFSCRGMLPPTCHTFRYKWLVTVYFSPQDSSWATSCWDMVAQHKGTPQEAFTPNDLVP